MTNRSDSSEAARIRMEREARDAWPELLTPYPWEWFATLTFRDPIGAEQAWRQLQRWLSWINRAAYGRRWRRRGDDYGILWACAIEYQRRGVIHFHVLIGDTTHLESRVSRCRAHDNWYRFAGNVKIEIIYGDVPRLARYFSKDAEIELSPSLRRYQEHRAKGFDCA